MHSRGIAYRVAEVNATLLRYQNEEMKMRKYIFLLPQVEIEPTTVAFIVARLPRDIDFLNFYCTCKKHTGTIRFR